MCVTPEKCLRMTPVHTRRWDAEEKSVWLLSVIISLSKFTDRAKSEGQTPAAHSLRSLWVHAEKVAAPVTLIEDVSI